MQNIKYLFRKYNVYMCVYTCEHKHKCRENVLTLGTDTEYGKIGVL